MLQQASRRAATNTSPGSFLWHRAPGDLHLLACHMQLPELLRDLLHAQLPPRTAPSCLSPQHLAPSALEIQQLSCAAYDPGKPKKQRACTLTARPRQRTTLQAGSAQLYGACRNSSWQLGCGPGLSAGCWERLQTEHACHHQTGHGTGLCHWRLTAATSQALGV